MKKVLFIGSAGARYSLENPQAYIELNVVGFMNILECDKKYINKK